MKQLYTAFVFVFISGFAPAQNALFIPPVLSGTTFNLTVQSGTQNFYPGFNTPTFGINGPFMSPTLVVNKGDSITLNVINNLPVKTTMHWHGLHVSAANDGGPHQSIAAGATWSPSFVVRNNAATFWYHPHGEGQTDPQVSKGLAGLFIVKDPAEAALSIPRTYGVDDFPIIVQTKDFDVLKQIAIATNTDTAVFVNGTLDPYLDIPAQVIRMRLLNGSSLRTFNFGLSNNQDFYLIATDGGLVDTPVLLNRIRLSPGERAEILVDLAGMSGQTLNLMSFSSELSKGIYGADSVGTGNDTIHEYYENFLNGGDFNLLALNVIPPTANPVVGIPQSLVPYNPFLIANASKTRTIVMDTIRLLPGDIPNRAEGPFGMNGKTFDMDSINEIVYLNTTEVWKLVNKTLVAHPFHIHDIQFNILEKSGVPPPASEQGWKDLILVMPGDSVSFITKFETFADPMVPYMFHCHLLHHEDDGMMGSFIVVDSAWVSGMDETLGSNNFVVYPNPGNIHWQVRANNSKGLDAYLLYNIYGQVVDRRIFPSSQDAVTIANSSLGKGLYVLSVFNGNNIYNLKLIKN